MSGIRRLTLLQKQDGLSVDEFKSRLLGGHSDLARQLQGIQGYRINMVIDKPDHVPWDGVAESWFPSLDVAKAAFGEQDLLARLQSDIKSFTHAVAPMYVESFQAFGQGGD